MSYKTHFDENDTQNTNPVLKHLDWYRPFGAVRMIFTLEGPRQPQLQRACWESKYHNQMYEATRYNLPLLV